MNQSRLLPDDSSYTMLSSLNCPFFSLQKREAPSLVDTAAPLPCVHQPAQLTAAHLPHPHRNRFTTLPTSTTTTFTTWLLRPLLYQPHLSQLHLLLLFTVSSTCGNTSHHHHPAPAPCQLPHQSLSLLHLHHAHRCATSLPQSAHQPVHQFAARSDQDKLSYVYIQEDCDSDDEEVVVYGIVLWCVFTMLAVNTAVLPGKKKTGGKIWNHDVDVLVTPMYGRFFVEYSRVLVTSLCVIASIVPVGI